MSLAPTGQIKKKLIFQTFPKMWKTSSLTKYLQRLHKEKCTFNTISVRILLRIEALQNKFLVESKKHIFCSINLFLKSTFYEIMWKNMLGSDTEYMII